ncbi:hypothetical protein AB3N58_10420 [Leptospira sp. WS60.C2]
MELDETLATLLPVFFGWLLGIISTLLIEQIRRWIKLSKIKKIAHHQLTDLGSKILLSSYLIKQKVGKLTIDDAKSFVEISKKYYPNLISQDLIDILEKILTSNQDEFKVLIELHKDSKHALNLKKYTLSLFQHGKESIDLLSPELFANLLEIDSKLTEINQEIEYANKSFDLTFSDSLSTSKIGQHNLINSYMFISSLFENLHQKILNTKEKI